MLRRHNHMLRRHTAVTRASCRAGALCHGAHSACVLALSRATAGHLGPGGACHSEPIQSRQPVPLASVALLLRRARFDDAVGRLGLRRIGPRLHHTRHTACVLLSQLGQALQISEAKKYLGLRPKPPDSASGPAKAEHTAREPAWRLLHAVTLLRLHQARTRAHMAYHNQTGPHEPHQTKPKHILRAIRQRCTARLSYEHAKAVHALRNEPKAGPRQGAWYRFHKQWISTGIASIAKGGRPRLHLCSRRRRQPPRLRPAPSTCVWQRSSHLPGASAQPRRPGPSRPTK